LKEAKQRGRDMGLKSTPDDCPIHRVIRGLDIEESQNRSFTVVVLCMLDTQFMKTESLVRSTTMSTEATLSDIKWRSSSSQLILEAQFE
jgi:hypothetical protein